MSIKDLNKDKLVAEFCEFVKTSAKSMSESTSNYTYYKYLPEMEDSMGILPYRMCVVLAWVDGYEVADNDEYIDKDGYGIEVSLRFADTSYFVEDWEYAYEGCGTHIESADTDENIKNIVLSLIEDFIEYNN
jgi:hypothetical protein